MVPVPAVHLALVGGALLLYGIVEAQKNGLPRPGHLLDIDLGPLPQELAVIVPRGQCTGYPVVLNRQQRGPCPWPWCTRSRLSGNRYRDPRNFPCP